MPLGLVMPKLRRNSLMGLRTKWSLSSDEAWEKSQRFGGKSLAVTGVLVLLGNIILSSGTSSTVFSLGLLTVSVVVSVLYTYWAAKD